MAMTRWTVAGQHRAPSATAMVVFGPMIAFLKVSVTFSGAIENGMFHRQSEICAHQVRILRSAYRLDHEAAAASLHGSIAGGAAGCATATP